MKHPISMRNGLEVDAFSKRARKWLRFRPGERTLIKRWYWKRARKALKRESKNEIVSWNIESMAP